MTPGQAALVVIGALLLGSCATGSMPRRTAAVDDAATGLETEIHDLVNRHRQSRGLRPLALDPRIVRVARRHSADMAAAKVRFGHDGFAERAAALREGGPTGVAENVAYESGPQARASAVVEGWVRSAGHRENIEGPYERTGVGAARNAAGELYVTQIFARGG